MIEKISAKTGLTKSDIFRRAIEMYAASQAQIQVEEPIVNKEKSTSPVVRFECGDVVFFTDLLLKKGDTLDIDAEYDTLEVFVDDHPLIEDFDYVVDDDKFVWNHSQRLETESVLRFERHI